MPKGGLPPDESRWAFANISNSFNESKNVLILV